MHDLLQEMGREIVHQEYPRKPEKWSRLWEFNDVYHVLQREMERVNIYIYIYIYMSFNDVFCLISYIFK